MFKFIKNVTLASAIFAVATQCQQAPKSDKAETKEATKIEEKTASNELEVDTKNSEVSWVGTKPTGQHDGVFKLKEGKIKLDGDKIVGGNVVIDIKTLEVKDLEKGKGKEDLEKHLLNKDFFEVEKFPTAEFVIDKVVGYEAPKEKSKDKKEDKFTLADPTHTIIGNLTLKGETKSISFPAKINIKDGKVEAKAKFNINRTDWKLSYHNDKSLGDKFIRPEVHLGFSFVAGK